MILLSLVLKYLSLKFLVLIFCIFSLFSFSQTDTLVFDTFRYQLKKTKLFFSENQQLIPSLPSEYKASKTKKVVKYKCKSQDVYESFDTNDGASVLVIKAVIDSSYQCRADSLVLLNVVDTITIHLNKLFAGMLYPSIKSQKHIYSLCSAKVYRLKNDTLVQCDWNYNYGPLSIDFDFDNLRFPNPKGAQYIITDMYYRKGNATYFLDKSLIVTVQ